MEEKGEEVNKLAKCGILEYDELPGRVGLIDVDYLRRRLSINTKPSIINKIFRIKLSETEEVKVIAKLEEARLKYNSY